MDKLELKDIVGYLPYDLKCQGMGKWEEGEDYVDESTEKIFTMSGICTDSNEERYIEVMYGNDKDEIYFPDDFFPILRPMSDLTKEITNNEETFVPIVELGKLCGYDKLEKYEEDETITYGWCDCNGEDYSGYTFSWYEKERCFAIWGDEIHGEPYYLANTKLSVYDKLNELHFDYRGLIERGLAVSELDYDNPYK